MYKLNVYTFINAIIFITNKKINSGGTTIQSSTTTSGDGDFEYNFKDTVAILIIKKIYGLFIGKMVDFKFEKMKSRAICVVLLVFISGLFFVITYCIRNAYDLDWEMKTYGFLFIISQVQDVFYEIGFILSRYCIGNCCVPKVKSMDNNGYELMDGDINIHKL